MISVNQLCKSYGDQVLFNDVSFAMHPGERLGLLGRNGHGKSTLFKILAEEESADSGKILWPKDYRIGFIHQNILSSSNTVLQEVCAGLPEDEKEDVWKAKKALSGLGFLDGDFDRPSSEFSSGFRMRLALAQLLVSQPNLLLLDEPTNFLDILSIRWLRDFLRQWPTELLLISHDRDFMDAVCTHVMGIHRGNIRKLKGNTAHYYDQLSKEEEVYERERQNTMKVRKKEEEFINKFRAKARRAGQAQSRMKRLEKMEVGAKLETIEDLRFSFSYRDFPAKVYLTSEDVAFRYDKNKPYLIDHFSLDVQQGDKICIIGQNGAGKSTLLRVLAERLQAEKGILKWHPQTYLGYFDQDFVHDLNPDETIEQAIGSCLPMGEAAQSRHICGAMMFSGDAALKKIDVLSGGEKCRVLLGQILAKPHNVLILDEPTHHLDIQSCQALIEAVQEFPGSVLIVSHDEHFLKEVATKLVIFQDDRMELFLGTYQEFLDRGGWTSEEVPHDVNPQVQELRNKKDIRKQRAEERLARDKVLKPLQTKVNDLEQKIEMLEALKEDLNVQMLVASEAMDSKRIQSVGQDLAQVSIDLEQTYEQFWLASEAYEVAQKDVG